MVKLIEKSIHMVQLKDFTLNYVCDFYSNENNRKVILLIFNGNEYFSNISYEEAATFLDEKELIYFVGYLSKEKSLSFSSDIEKGAEKILQKNPYVYILLKNSEDLKKGIALFYTNLIFIEQWYTKALNELKDTLQTENINVHLIKIPQIGDLEEKVKHPEWTLGRLSAKLNWTEALEGEMKKYLSKFTELDYANAKKSIIDKSFTNQLGDGLRTIYLVGPCIAAGWENFEGDTFGDVLYEKLKSLQLDYKIVEVLIQRYTRSNIKSILEYDIKKNDIVLIIDDIIDIEKADINLDYIYNDYIGEKWLYSDYPIHTTYECNQLIANELMKYIIIPLSNKANEAFDQFILHKKERQLTYEELKGIGQYLKTLKSIKKGNGEVIGACVMTCNPFTYGHLHLIEYASKQVDFLYVFIVEEDKVFFPFKDRIEMVRKGTHHLKNIAVLPSGKFIISEETFKNYFEKEMIPFNSVIDASKDIMIFKKYIGPALGISRRFLGQEPIDNVTNQYNQALKQGLSDTMEIIEIPRKTVKKEVISASRVRYHLERGNWH